MPWLAAALMAVALLVLVVVRVTDDGDATRALAPPSPEAPAGGPSAVTTTRPITEVEAFLDEPPAEVSDEDLGGIGFTDVTEAAGLSRPQASAELETAMKADLSMSSGAAVADVDADGDADLYVTRVGLANSLYRNDGDGTFTDIALQAGVDRTPPEGGYQGSGAAAFADIDGDGCLDLYVAGVGNGKQPGEAALFVNDCAGRFEEQTAERGVALPATDAALGAQGHGVTFADYDHDGDLDLLVLHWDPAFLGGKAAALAYEQFPDPDSLCERTRANRAAGADRTPAAGPNRSRLFRNDGTGRFHDVTDELGLPLDRIAGFTGDFVDMDGDGWEDLLIAGDFCTSALFRNDQGTGFTDVTEEAGVATDENGMGSVVRDLDGDGRPDWFVTSISGRTKSGACPTRTGNTACSGNRVYRNRGGLRFDDATDELGVRAGSWGWGAAIEDFGNDGRLGIVAATGYAGEEPPRDQFLDDPLHLWIPLAGRPEVRRDAAASAGLTETGLSHAVIPFDYDGDGDQDLFVANFGDPPNLYRNDAPADRHQVTVRLDDLSSPGNRAGVGSKVRVSWGSASSTGWITTSGSYESQRLPEHHVGLGSHDGPVTIEVWWPGETEPVRSTETRIDRVITVRRA
ncbi:MAG: hypothetical protein JWO77_2590 [Ilumatobacteraceae bacterium]|nr:hypothetical protein [Ilumatobacteraceae bacterium]